jgi:hypothetical protein
MASPLLLAHAAKNVLLPTAAKGGAELAGGVSKGAAALSGNIGLDFLFGQKKQPQQPVALPGAPPIDWAQMPSATPINPPQLPTAQAPQLAPMSFASPTMPQTAQFMPVTQAPMAANIAMPQFAGGAQPSGLSAPQQAGATAGQQVAESPAQAPAWHQQLQDMMAPVQAQPQAMTPGQQYMQSPFVQHMAASGIDPSTISASAEGMAATPQTMQSTQPGAPQYGNLLGGGAAINTPAQQAATHQDLQRTAADIAKGIIKPQYGNVSQVINDVKAGGALLGKRIDTVSQARRQELATQKFNDLNMPHTQLGGLSIAEYGTVLRGKLKDLRANNEDLALHQGIEERVAKRLPILEAESRVNAQFLSATGGRAANKMASIMSNTKTPDAHIGLIQTATIQEQQIDLAKMAVNDKLIADTEKALEPIYKLEAEYAKRGDALEKELTEMGLSTYQAYLKEIDTLLAPLAAAQNFAVQETRLLIAKEAADTQQAQMAAQTSLTAQHYQAEAEQARLKYAAETAKSGAELDLSAGKLQVQRTETVAKATAEYMKAGMDYDEAQKAAIQLFNDSAVKPAEKK